MLTYEGLKAIFGRAKKTQWILYKGQSKGTQIGSYISDEEISVEDSLAELEQIMSAYGAGVYTIECRAGKTHSKGNDLHTFTFGDINVGAVTKSGVTLPVSTSETKFFQGLDARYFMDQQLTLQQQVMNLQLEVMKKEMAITELKRDLKDAEKEPDDNGIIGFIGKNPALVGKIIDRVLPGAPAAAIGVLKSEQATVPTPETDDEGYETDRLDLNALADAADRIQTAIPDIPVNTILDKLAAYCEVNPQQARNLLTMI